MPTRSKVKINKSAVDKLTVGDKIWDSEIAGFGVRANKGSKTYVLKTILHGKQKFITIGKHGAPYTPDAARKKAQELLGKIVQGIDPKKESYKGMTVSALCNKYMTDHAEQHKKPSSQRMDRTNIKNHILPLLGNMRVQDVNYTDIETFRNSVKDGVTAPSDPARVIKEQGGGSATTGGEGVANKCLALLSKMFELSIKWGIRKDLANPVRGVERYKSKAIERFLNPLEIRTLFEALDAMEETKPMFVAAIRLLLYTGARSSEIQTLKWEYVDFDARLLRLPDSKTGAKVIRLNEDAIKILQGMKRLENNPYVIIGGKDASYLVNIRKPWADLLKKAGLENVRIHDLRHTFASIAVQKGITLQEIAALLGHTNTATTQRYAHLAKDQISKANDNIGSAINNYKKK